MLIFKDIPAVDTQFLLCGRVRSLKSRVTRGPRPAATVALFTKKNMNLQF